MPIAALNSLGPTDVFVHLEERGPVGPTGGGFAERPERFADELVGIDEGTDAWACIDEDQRADIGVLRWIDFQDHGRGLYLLVAIGTGATSSTLASTAAALESLVIDRR